MGCWAMVGDYSEDSSGEENLNLLLRLTQIEASVDLKRQRDDEFLKGFCKSKDAGGFHSYSWQRSVA